MAPDDLSSEPGRCSAGPPDRSSKKTAGRGLIYLVSGSTRSLREAVAIYPHRLGFLLTPNAGNSVESVQGLGIPWAADNAAFSGWNEDAFMRMLSRLQGTQGCSWVAAPDVVGDARATLAQFHWWALWIRRHSQKVALVGQDGAEDLLIPWDDLDAYFIGGSTRWKLSQASADLGAEAKRRGKWLHMGRVNSFRRLIAAYDMGCDSVDGSSASRFGDVYIRRYCRWIGSLESQATLYEGER